MFVSVSLVPSDSYAVGIMGTMGMLGIRLCLICVDVIVCVVLPCSLVMIALPHNPHYTQSTQTPHQLRKRRCLFEKISPFAPFINLARSAPYFSVFSFQFSLFFVHLYKIKILAIWQTTILRRRWRIIRRRNPQSVA